MALRLWRDQNQGRMNNTINTVDPFFAFITIHGSIFLRTMEAPKKDGNANQGGSWMFRAGGLEDPTLGAVVGGR